MVYDAWGITPHKTLPLPRSSPSNTRFLGVTTLTTPNGISIASAVFTQYTVISNGQNERNSTRNKRPLKPKFHDSSFLSASSLHPCRHAQLATNILARMSVTSRVCRAYPATFPSSLLRACLIGRPAVCCGVVLPVYRLSVCRCRFQKSTSTTRTTCCGHPREDPRSILVRHDRHARFPRDLLTSSPGCHEDAARILRGKLVPWNSSLIANSHRPTRHDTTQPDGGVESVGRCKL